MTDILWVQTEPKSSVLVDGMTEEIDIVDYVSVEDNPDFSLISEKQIKVFFNKKENCIVVHGHVDNLDSVGRKIAFAFYAKEKNIFRVMALLKQRLISIGLVPPSEIIKNFLHMYINQNFIPFWSKRKFYKVLIFVAVSILSVLSLFFCKLNNLNLIANKQKTNVRK